MKMQTNIDSTSAGGAAEGSQGQAALRAAPGSVRQHKRALKGRASITKHCANRIHSLYSFYIHIFGLVSFFTPFQGIVDVTQGLRVERLPLATFCRASGAG